MGVVGAADKVLLGSWARRVLTARWDVWVCKPCNQGVCILAAAVSGVFSCESCGAFSCEFLSAWFYMEVRAQVPVLPSHALWVVLCLAVMQGGCC